MKKEQLRKLINRTLELFAVKAGIPSLAGEAATELLMLTAAQESKLGEYIEQMGSGPAKGIFQIEPATWKDIQENYLKYKPELAEAVKGFDTALDDNEDLTGNLLLQIVIARLIYFRAPDPLPNASDINGLAFFWKKHFNTKLGKGKPVDAIRNYKELAMEVKV